MQITIPEDIVAEIEREAKIRNLMPEDVAMAALRTHFAVNGSSSEPRKPSKEAESSQPIDEEEFKPKNLREFLGDFVGCVSSNDRFPQGSKAARDASKAFGEILEVDREKRKRR